MSDQKSARRPVSAGQEPVLEFKISHKTRDQLIITFSQLCNMLQFKGQVPDAARERASEKINDTVLILLELSVENMPPPLLAVDSFEEFISNELMVCLPASTKYRMILHLAKIKDAVRFTSKFTEEAKLRLIEETKSILDCLVTLAEAEVTEQIGRQEELVASREQQVTEHQEELATERQEGLVPESGQEQPIKKEAEQIGSDVQNDTDQESVSSVEFLMVQPSR